GVIAALVHQPRQLVGLLEHGGELVVLIAPLVGRGGHLAHVGQVHVARVDGGEPADHVGSFRAAPETGRWPRSAEMSRAVAFTSAPSVLMRGRTRSVGPPLATAPATCPSRCAL